MERAFRFSVTMPAATAEEIRSFARKAEDLGFDVVMMADHVERMLMPFLPLMIAAEATSTIRFGTLVLNNDFRHPAFVAREVATFDSLTGGRFELGMGAGHARPEYEQLGLRFDQPAVRVARLGESVRIIKSLWHGELVSFTGEHYQLSEHRLFPVPAQAPKLLIGGNGRGLLRLAAREADIVALTGLGKTLPDGQRHETTGFTTTSVDDRVALVRGASGERFEGIELNALVQAVIATDTPAITAEEMTARLPGLSVDDILGTPFLLIGSAAQMAEALLERRARWGISYYSVFGPAMDALAPVIALLASRPAAS